MATSTHKRKNDNKTIYQPSNETISRCKGSLIIDSGECYYTLLFEPLQCCVFASICNAEDENVYNYSSEEEDEDNKIDWVDFWRLWPDYNDPHDYFPGPVIEAGFYVNMDKKLVVIYDAKLKKENKRFNFNLKRKKISPIVFFKHVVSITVSSKGVGVVFADSRNRCCTAQVVGYHVLSGDMVDNRTRANRCNLAVRSAIVRIVRRGRDEGSFCVLCESYDIPFYGRFSNS